MKRCVWLLAGLLVGVVLSVTVSARAKPADDDRAIAAAAYQKCLGSSKAFEGYCAAFRDLVQDNLLTQRAAMLANEGIQGVWTEIKALRHEVAQLRTPPCK
jgi:hypothetical protein